LICVISITIVSSQVQSSNQRSADFRDVATNFRGVVVHVPQRRWTRVVLVCRIIKITFDKTDRTDANPTGAMEKTEHNTIVAVVVITEFVGNEIVECPKSVSMRGDMVGPVKEILFTNPILARLDKAVHVLDTFGSRGVKSKQTPTEE